MNKGVRFDINPHVIRQLGAELVSDHITALMELIKNSYDADASYVYVKINTHETLKENGLFNKTHSGYIIIDDDGCGMDEDTILNSWLVISYSKKRAIGNVKPKTDKQRTPLGDKGLGRLSTQRLADSCEIFTKMKDARALHVGFNWNDFDGAKKLSDVAVDFEEVSIGKKHGTKMILTDLADKDAWKGASLERFKALLCQLVSPIEGNQPFKVYLEIDGEQIDLYVASQTLGKLSIADFSFQYENGVMRWEGSIDKRMLIGNDYSDFKRYILWDNGKSFLDHFFDEPKSKTAHFRPGDNNKWLQLDLSFTVEEALRTFQKEKNFCSTIADPGPFKGKIRDFSFSNIKEDSGWWSHFYKTFDEYKSFAQNQVGIKIYRNGFGVRPYGIDGKDWLDLGKSKTTGASYYELRPGNVSGYIAIDEALNVNLKDKTDREGFYENEYYRSFEAILKMLIKQINEALEVLRRYYNTFKNDYAQNNQKITTMKQALETIEEQSSKGVQISAQYAAAQKQLEDIQRKIIKVTQDNNGDLFADSNDSVSKQILKDVADVLAESKMVLAQANEVLKNSSYLGEALMLIKPKLETLEMQLDDFSELASLGLISEMVSHDLGQIADRMLGKGIELESNFKANGNISATQVYSLVSFIKNTVTSLRSQIKHLDSSMKYNREKKDIFSIVDMLQMEELEYYEKKMNHLNITLKVVRVEDFYVKMNKGKLIQVFDNLINNSLYWLKQDINEPTITIIVDKPWIMFEDNGMGIATDVEETLFEPFVTRKPKTEGRGLGLFIIQQLLDSNNCDIVLDQRRNQFGNRYRFVINMSGVINNQ